MSKRLQQDNGFTLIEVCIGLVIASILLASAIPSLQQWVLRERMQATAQSMLTDLQQARSEAVMRAGAVQLRFSRSARGSCYVLHTGASGGCRCSEDGQAICSANARVLRVNWIPSQQRLTVQANVSNLSFQPRQGAVTSTGSIDITGVNGQTIRQIISITGRVRSCSPDGGFKNLARCAT